MKNKTRQRANKTNVGSAKTPPSPVRLQILLSHGCAVGMAFFAYFLLGDLTSWSLSVRLILAVLLGVGFGFLFSISLILGISFIESALRQLAAGQIIDPPLYHPWPLGRLLTVIDELSGHGYQVSELRGTLSEKMQAAAAQEERNRLARDLHDSIKQQIFSMSVSAAAVEVRWDADPVGAKEALADVRRGAKEAMVEMNAMLQQLRPAPLEKVGLIEALHEQYEALGYRTGAKVTAELKSLPPNEHLPVGTQEVLFRITQEALSNVARHARASEVHLRLGTYKKAQREFLFLEIKDNGRGFDEQAVDFGMGLNNIRQRAQSIAGRAEVKSRPGYGTVVRVMDIAITPPIAVTAPAELLSQYSLAEREIIKQMNAPNPFLFSGTKMPGCFLAGLVVLISFPLLFFYGGTAVAIYALLVGAICLYLNGKKILESHDEAKMARKSGGSIELMWAVRRQHLWQFVFLLQMTFWLPIQLLTWLPRVGIEQFWLFSPLLIFLMAAGMFYEQVQMMKLDHTFYKQLPALLQPTKIPKPAFLIFTPFYLLLVFPDNGFVALTLGEFMLVAVYFWLILATAIIIMRNSLLWYWQWRLFPQKRE